MDMTFWLCCAIVCSVFVCYVVAYLLHSLPLECPSAARMDNKTVLITGGSCGIGHETALELARRGARVIIASRHKTRGDAAVKSVIDETGNRQVFYQQVDLSDWQSVRSLTQRIINSETRLDVLINNAGIAGSDCGRLSRHGYDRVFAVNYLGHFLLVNQLLPLLVQSAPSRIVSVTSVAQTALRESLFDAAAEDAVGDEGLSTFCRRLAGYDASKLAMVLHVKELCRRLAAVDMLVSGTGVTANCLHPGVVYTDLWRQKVPHIPVWFQRLVTFAMRPLFMSARDAAQTSVYCAVAKELDGVSGKYFRRCRVSLESTLASDSRLTAQLWHVSMVLTGCVMNGQVDHMTFINCNVKQFGFSSRDDDDEHDGVLNPLNNVATSTVAKPSYFSIDRR